MVCVIRQLNLQHYNKTALTLVVRQLWNDRQKPENSWKIVCNLVVHLKIFTCFFCFHFQALIV